MDFTTRVNTTVYFELYGVGMFTQFPQLQNEEKNICEFYITHTHFYILGLFVVWHIVSYITRTHQCFSFATFFQYTIFLYHTCLSLVHMAMVPTCFNANASLLTTRTSSSFYCFIHCLDSILVFSWMVKYRIRWAIGIKTHTTMWPTTIFIEGSFYLNPRRLQ